MAKSRVVAGGKGLPRRLIDLTFPGRISRAFAAGRLLCLEHRDGERTWEDWLGDRFRPASTTLE